MKASKRIKRAMIDNEREVLRHIRRSVVCRCLLYSHSWTKARDRLESKGVIRYSKAKAGYVVNKPWM